MAQPMKELSNRHLQIQQWEENAKTDSEAGFRKQAKLVDNILEHTSRQVNQSKIVSENNWQEIEIWIEICQEIYMTKFSGERILHTENASIKTIFASNK